ncbi:MAG: hypothetical protein CMH30_00020 [Micavibrio sp.]|nr:hypothetical protein [Micavibrio sp.]
MPLFVNSITASYSHGKIDVSGTIANFGATPISGTVATISYITGTAIKANRLYGTLDGALSVDANNTFTGTNIFNGNLTASLGGLVKDDKRLFFGDSEESWVKYDESGDDFLVISGSASGVGISGSVIRLDGNVQVIGGNNTLSGSTLGFNRVGATVMVSAPLVSGTVVQAHTATTDKVTGRLGSLTTVTGTTATVSFITGTAIKANRFYGNLQATAAAITTVSGTTATVSFITGTSVTANRFFAAGNIEPTTDNARDLGSAAKRWANIYTGDLHLANSRGDWTVIEEPTYLTLRNNKNGKRYKLVMEELSEGEYGPGNDE